MSKKEVRDLFVRYFQETGDGFQSISSISGISLDSLLQFISGNDSALTEEEFLYIENLFKKLFDIIDN